MRASRLLSILMLIQMRGRIAAPALARELEVSVRTIYRDIDALSAAGVPIYAETGRNGGVCLHEGWRTKITGLTAAESAALPLAGLPGAAKELGLSAEAAQAQLKLIASLPADASAAAGRIAERFFVDPLPWYHRAETLDWLPELAAAVWGDRRISIGYEAWSGEVTRELSPLGLVHKGGVWYLVAVADRGEPRTYRVGNILRLAVLEAPASRPAKFDLSQFWATWAAAFEERLIAGRATLRLSPEGRQILRAVNPAMAQAVEASARAIAPEGWVEAEAPVETADYSARQLLRLGTEVEVLAPKELRAAVQKEAQAVLLKYSVDKK